MLTFCSENWSRPVHGKFCLTAEKTLLPSVLSLGALRWCRIQLVTPRILQTSKLLWIQHGFHTALFKASTRAAQEQNTQQNKKKRWKKTFQELFVSYKTRSLNFSPTWFCPQEQQNQIHWRIIFCHVSSPDVGGRPSSQVKQYKERTGSRIIYLRWYLRKGTRACQAPTCSQQNSRSLAPSWLVQHWSVAGCAAQLQSPPVTSCPRGEAGFSF